jgi:2',3'-cyclic-nucleotide 2'-phosphodiesterase (5'-nucleotidase family)
MPPAAILLRYALVLLSGLVVAGYAQDRTADIEVGLVHVNDVYQIAPIDSKAPRGGLARLAGLVGKLRAEHPATLFLFGGDTLSPGIESGLFKGAQMMRAWNATGVDLAVPGNHEFDFGEAVARERFAESRFPWLAANLHADPPLPALKAERVAHGRRRAHRHPRPDHAGDRHPVQARPAHPLHRSARSPPGARPPPCAHRARRPWSR